jgi:hypothetical protein
MHLHGHWFWIVGFGRPFEGAYKGQELRPSVIRDTATIANKSWLAIRFIADNPGSWILHCHIGESPLDTCCQFLVTARPCELWLILFPSTAPSPCATHV